jgi:N-acetyl-anhydromuramyl-L-alanine amidase AmpD
MTMQPIRYLTIHCAATPEARDVKAASIERWDVEKFGQKSYHWIVELDGFAHRSLDDSVRGAHVGGHNSGNIGVCYIGGCDADMRHAKDTRTDAQKAALLNLVETYVAHYPGLIVRGHRDWPGVHKDCPSFNVKAWLAAGMPCD